MPEKHRNTCFNGLCQSIGRPICLTQIQEQFANFGDVMLYLPVFHCFPTSDSARVSNGWPTRRLSI